MKEMLSGFSSSYFITKIMASLYYPFCDSANNSFSLLVFGRQLWQKVYHMLSFLSYKKFFSSSLIGSNASWKRNYQKFQETSLQKNGTHTHTQKSYQELQHDNINILAQITNMSSQIYTVIMPWTWPMSKLGKNEWSYHFFLQEQVSKEVEQDRTPSEQKPRTPQEEKGRSDLTCGVFSGNEIKQQLMSLQRKQMP